MQKWERLNPGEPVDVTADMTRLTLDTIALCGFGYRFNSFYRDTQHPFVERHVRSCCRRARSGPVQLPIQTRAAARAHSRSCRESYRLHGETRSSRSSTSAAGAGNAEDHRDLLSCMLTGVDKRTGEKLSDDNIVAPVPDLPDCRARDHQRPAVLCDQLSR